MFTRHSSKVALSRSTHHPAGAYPFSPILTDGTALAQAVMAEGVSGNARFA
jgi:hypothetical protein